MILKKKTYTIRQLQIMLRQAKTEGDIREIRKLFPTITAEDRVRRRRQLDDGIYDSNGTIIGEKHHED